MTAENKKPGSSDVGVERLLGRGSRVLGLASIARASGQRASEGPWYVLSQNTVDPAEEILKALEEKPDQQLLEASVRAAMSDEPASVPPAWTKAIAIGGDIIDRIGNFVDAKKVEKIVGQDADMTSVRVRGLAALAIAFCRSRDTLEALTKSFEKKDRLFALQTGALAGVLVEPMEPSSMRRHLKELLKQFEGVNDG